MKTTADEIEGQEDGIRAFVHALYAVGILNYVQYYDIDADISMYYWRKLQQ